MSAPDVKKPKIIPLPPIERMASGTWRGDLKSGTGTIAASSGVLTETPFSFATRFQNEKGTNPEELIAAAHAACYSMAFSNYLSQHGHVPDEVRTNATVTLQDGKISAVHLEARGNVAGVDSETFKRYAEEAEKTCPVSTLLRPGLTITLDADLVG